MGSVACSLVYDLAVNVALTISWPLKLLPTTDAVPITSTTGTINHHSTHQPTGSTGQYSISSTESMPRPHEVRCRRLTYFAESSSINPPTGNARWGLGHANQIMAWGRVDRTLVHFQRIPNSKEHCDHHSMGPTAWNQDPLVPVTRCCCAQAE